MKRSHLLTLTVMIGIALAAPALAAKKDPVDYRRTLFVPVGQKTLVFEAPLKMCFLSPSASYEGSIYKAFAGNIERKGKQVLLAVFADCLSVGGLSSSSGTNNIPLNAGTITWMNPSIGETTPLKRHEYLDMRESSFHQYVENSGAVPPSLHLDAVPRRTENGVALGASGETTVDYAKSDNSVVIATTTLRQFPIEITLRYNGQDIPSPEKIYPLMDKFIAQQIALNE